MRRANHYDAAFEAWLRSQGCPYVAIDETRRATLAEGSLKSVDFLVYSAERGNLLVDIKGRAAAPLATARASTGPITSGSWRQRARENWVTRDDVESLLVWERIFGAGFRGMFVFAYGEPEGAPEAALLARAARQQPFAFHPPEREEGADELQASFAFRGWRYGFYGVWVQDFASQMRRRSARWETVWLPTEVYRRLRFPLDALSPPVGAGQAC